MCVRVLWMGLFWNQLSFVNGIHRSKHPIMEVHLFIRILKMVGYFKAVFIFFEWVSLENV